MITRFDVIGEIGMIKGESGPLCNHPPYVLREKRIVIFYTEILTEKVALWCFFSSETSEKIHNSTFQVKISV